MKDKFLVTPEVLVILHIWKILVQKYRNTPVDAMSALNADSDDYFESSRLETLQSDLLWGHLALESTVKDTSGSFPIERMLALLRTYEEGAFPCELILNDKYAAWYESQLEPFLMASSVKKLFGVLKKKKQMVLPLSEAFPLAHLLISNRQTLLSRAENGELAEIADMRKIQSGDLADEIRQREYPVRLDYWATKDLPAFIDNFLHDWAAAFRSGKSGYMLKWSEQKKKLLALLKEQEEKFTECRLSSETFHSSFPDLRGMRFTEVVFALMEQNLLIVEDLRLSDNDIEFLITRNQSQEDEEEEKHEWIRFGDFEFSHDPLSIRKGKERIDWKSKGKVDNEKIKSERKGLKALEIFLNRDGSRRVFTGIPDLAKVMKSKPESVSSALTHARNLLIQIGSKCTITRGHGANQIRLDEG